MSAAVRLLVWGGGGHGRVVADTARAAGLAVVGFADRDATKVGMVVEPGGARVVIDQSSLEHLLGGSAPLPEAATHIALGIGDNVARLRAAELAGDRCAPAIVHPAASVSVHASLDRGTVVMPNAVVNSAARAGIAVIVNSGAIVEHDCVLGDGAHISPGAVLAGGVSVGRLGWIAAGAVVIPMLRVGERAVVGAGAVVLRDVADATTVVGNPARLLRRA